MGTLRYDGDYNIIQRCEAVDEYAKLLNGREYLNELTKEEEEDLKEKGIVVVFGYSDDNTEFRGAMYEEIPSYGGTTIYFDEDGIFEGCECECKYSEKVKNRCEKIEVLWDRDGYSWTYKTDKAVKTFDILDDGDLYCKGIIFLLDQTFERAFRDSTKK